MGPAGPAPRLRVRHLFVLVPMALPAAVLARPVADNSFLWHVRAGTTQLDLGRVLTTDPFSFTRPGAPWRTQSWLVELAYGWAERATGGLSWAHPQAFLAVTLTLALVALVVARRVRGALDVGVWMLPVVWAVIPAANPRPAVWGLAALAAVALVADLDDRHSWLAVPILWLWAAAHGSWLVGLGLLVLDAARRRSRRRGLVAAAALAAALATAHGPFLLEVPAAFVRARGALRLIEEWAAPDVVSFIGGPLVLLVVAVVGVAVSGRLRARDLWLVLPFLLFGLTSRRAIAPALVVALPLVAVPLPGRLGARRSPAGPLPVVVTALVGVLVVGALARGGGVVDPERFPSDATVAAAVATGRFLHEDAVGGYLIYEGQLPVFVDDRAELYGEELFTAYVRAVAGRPEGLLDRYRIDGVLLGEDRPLVAVLRSRGWEERLRDAGFVVLARP